jgi:cytochrome b561
MTRVAADSAPGVRPPALVALHWLTVAALCAAVAAIFWRESVDGRVLRDWLIQGHRHFGLLVLAMAGLRLAVRWRSHRGGAHDATAPILRAAASLAHGALYALLFTLPLLGWAASSAADRTVSFLGVALPALVHADEDLADRLAAWHSNAAWALLGLVLLHVAAALWHHYALRDNTLIAMLPRSRRSLSARR